MNFEFSDDLLQLRDQARRYLAEHSTPKHVRAVLDGEKSYDGALWLGMAEMGWLGAAIPEEFGGAGLGHEGLCVLAEEIGRVAAPVPFASSIYLAAEAIMLAGSSEQKRRLLQGFAAGMHIGTLAWAEGPGNPRPGTFTPRLVAGKLTGTKWPVPDGGSADLAVVAAQDEADRPILALADLRAGGITRTALETVDPSRPQATLVFDGTPAEQLGAAGEGWDLLQAVLDRAAVLFAFEQIGGAATCLDMATAYAQERYAFGRPIGSFQAIKHKLADVYIANELARSNAYYGAWALEKGAAELTLAASSARVSATVAYHLASKENIQTHGGMGFTWAADCHLFYRRAKLLALTIGSAPHWKNRLVAELETRNAA
jgi:alkylation response protein AidB-like acyl-CoA dehydrogenase